jgi:hypothetical protein
MRRVSAVVGALVADAASVPLQWIYEDATMRGIVGDRQPEFWPESHCPFFTLPTGSLSCYGDELATCLASLAATGQLQLPDLQAAIVAKFGAPDSPYQTALAKRADKKFPVAGPWLNGGVIQSLANMEEGVAPPGSKACKDQDGLAVSLPVLLLPAGQGPAAASLLTTHPAAIDHLAVQAAILANCLAREERPVEAALAAAASSHPAVAAEGEAVVAAAAAGASLSEMVERFGKACGLPGSFQGQLAALLACKDFVPAVRLNILAGGDCCARGVLIGACLGASLGVGAIPMEWIERVEGMQQILDNAIKVFASSDQ